MKDLKGGILCFAFDYDNYGNVELLTKLMLVRTLLPCKGITGRILSDINTCG